MFHLMSASTDEMTFEQLKGALQKLDAMDDRMEMMAQMGMNMGMFKAMDVNNDGKISLREYKFAVIPLGVTEEDCEVAFNMIDANGDGFLSHEEFGFARAHYYFDKDDTIYKHFYGKFKDE